MLAKYESAGSLVAPSRSTTSSPHTIGNVHSKILRGSSSGSSSSSSSTQDRPFRHIFIITGPAGCGKSSVAMYLAKQLSLPYIEGDDYHPQSNVDKMANGIPLTDDDRWSWLETIRNVAITELESGAAGAVVTCSCLKRKYRDVIRLAARGDDQDAATGAADDVVLRFVYLRANKELLLARVRARRGHWMKDDMVASQFEALEEPTEAERDVVSVDVSGSLESVLEATMDQVKRVMAGFV